MGFPKKLLGEGEHIVLRLRTHPKVLIGQAVVLFVALTLATVLWELVPDNNARPVLRWIIGIATALVIIAWVLRPVLSWWTTEYTITTERLITRRGILNRTGRDIPLGRINDVAFEQGFLDRFFRCGSLIVSAASEQGQEVLHDVPTVNVVQLRMSELVREAHGWVPNTRHGAPQVVGPTDAPAPTLTAPPTPLPPQESPPPVTAAGSAPGSPAPGPPESDADAAPGSSAGSTDAPPEDGPVSER